MECECLRCGHKWITKFDRKPKTCAKCKSPYWQKEMSEYWRKTKERWRAAKTARKEQAEKP